MRTNELIQRLAEIPDPVSLLSPPPIRVAAWQLRDWECADCAGFADGTRASWCWSGRWARYSSSQRLPDGPAAFCWTGARCSSRRADKAVTVEAHRIEKGRNRRRIGVSPS